MKITSKDINRISREYGRNPLDLQEIHDYNDYIVGIHVEDRDATRVYEEFIKFDNVEFHSVFRYSLHGPSYVEFLIKEYEQ